MLILFRSPIGLYAVWLIGNIMQNYCFYVLLDKVVVGIVFVMILRGYSLSFASVPIS